MRMDTDSGRRCAIRTERLTKSYGGSRGLCDLDLVVDEGEIFGFIGPNGAGKTTTIRLLLDLIRPDAGTAEVFGLDTRREAVAVHRTTGYLPGEFALDPHLSGRQALTYFSNLRGGVSRAEIESLAGQIGLDLDRPFGQYSRGNKQKVGLVQAFMHRPRLLILDEPTTGLDPLNQETVAAWVRNVKSEGRTVFFSSHVLSVVEALCDRVGFIRDGRLVRVAPVQELLGMRVHEFVAECADPLPADALAGVLGVSEVTVAGATVRGVMRGDVDALMKALARYHVRSFTSHVPSLSEVFLHLYEGPEPATTVPSTPEHPERDG